MAERNLNHLTGRDRRHPSVRLLTRRPPSESDVRPSAYPARVLMLVAGLDVRIVSEDGELLRELVLDPSRDYQPMGRTWNDVPGHV